MNTIKWIASILAAILIWPLIMYVLIAILIIAPIPVVAKYLKKQLDGDERWKW